MNVVENEDKLKSRARISVLNPLGYPPKPTRKSVADRLESLDGKTIYLVDCRFDDSIELLVAAGAVAIAPGMCASCRQSAEVITAAG
jgi:hypothetical protein